MQASESEGSGTSHGGAKKKFRRRKIYSGDNDWSDQPKGKLQEVPTSRRYGGEFSRQEKSGRKGGGRLEEGVSCR